MNASLIGQLMALLAALSFAVSNVMIAQGSRQGRNQDASIVFSILVTMVLSLLVWLVLERGQIAASDTGSALIGIVWFVLAGFAAMILGRTLVYRSIQTVGVIRASAVRRLNPLFSAMLGFVVLGETIAGLGLVGMALVFVAVGGLMVRPWLNKSAGREAASGLPALAYTWGIAAALAYSVSYLFRKFGLDELTGPAFGTFVSAVAGFAFYFTLAIFAVRYRRAIRGIFSEVNPQMMAAGIFMSIGQLLLFAAISFERIAVVAMIGSMEMFFSTFLAVLIGADKRPDGFTVIAGALATSGVILMALYS